MAAPLIEQECLMIGMFNAFRGISEWASISNEETHVTQHGEQIDDPRHETQARFSKYFSATGMRGFYALPLIDDQGRLGVLSCESSDPDFLTVAHLEILKVLAGQATVALRNASLYRTGQRLAQQDNGYTGNRSVTIIPRVA